MGVVSRLAFLLGGLVAYYYHNAVTNGVTVTVVRKMTCSSERAFQAVTDFDVMPQVNPDIVGYEFIDDPPMHLNMKFSETRRTMGTNSESLVTNLEVIEFTPQQGPQPHARMVADTHGTIWDTTFDVRPAGTGSQEQEEEVAELKISMHARAQKMIPKLTNPIMQVLFRFGLNKHIDGVKTWCENGAG